MGVTDALSLFSSNVDSDIWGCSIPQCSTVRLLQKGFDIPNEIFPAFLCDATSNSWRQNEHLKF